MLGKTDFNIKCLLDSKKIEVNCFGQRRIIPVNFFIRQTAYLNEHQNVTYHDNLNIVNMEYQTNGNIEFMLDNDQVIVCSLTNLYEIAVRYSEY